MLRSYARRKVVSKVPVSLMVRRELPEDNAYNCVSWHSIVLPRSTATLGSFRANDPLRDKPR